MKNVLATLCLLVISFSSFASHVMGGEITWRCLPNGKYIFSMTVYKDCNGVAYTFQNETITIQGTPLPQNSNAANVSSIVMLPDSSAFSGSNNGDISPKCSPTISNNLSCANGDAGAVQAFIYNSNPITLRGIPPQTGWKFFWESPHCCRAIDLQNVNHTSSPVLLRSIMYPLPGGLPADPCYDSSPFFRARPNALVCRGLESVYNYTAVDTDLDSLVYSWAEPIDPPQISPQTLTYKTGYSFTSPTPGQNLNGNNVPATLDPVTGISRMAVYNGTGIKEYLLVVRVDAYRQGIQIASVFREVPIAIYPCPDLPGTSGVQNNAPIVSMDGILTTSIVKTITAGRTITIPIQITDSDSSNISPFAQQLTMTPDGILFTSSKTGPSKGYQSDPSGEPCIISNKDVHPCAYLRNASPFVDATATPPVSIVQGVGTINTEFVWQTDCKQIQTRVGFPGTNENVYNFVLRVQDDHCPIPGISYPTITVKVKDPLPLEEPIVKGISVLLDGTTKYSWVPPVDSANQFNPPERRTDHYDAEYAETQNNQAPGFWITENGFITNYQQDKRSNDLFPYDLNNMINPLSGYNILAPKGTTQQLPRSNFYIRMRTLSGCTDTNVSRWSEPARIMQLNTEDGSALGQRARSATKLTWNRAKPVSAKSRAYWRYESDTRFYIHMNDSLAYGKLGNLESWNVVGSTYNTTYTVGGSVCNDYTAYRIEARDTVITVQEGETIESDKLDTLVFSTFSIVDTFYLVGSNPKVLSFGDSSLQADLHRNDYQWLDCATNTAITNATTKSFIPMKQGSYKVITANDINTALCRDTSACFTTPQMADSIQSIRTDTLMSFANEGEIEWLDCNAQAIVTSVSGRYFIPTKAGMYAAINKAYGYADTSNCIQTVELSDSVFLFNNDSLRTTTSGVKYQWYNCATNQAISGATSQIFKPQDTGYYKVVLSAYGYSDTSRCIPVLAIGVDETSGFAEEIVMHPNPTNGFVNIGIKSRIQRLNVSIRNIQGQLVQEQQFRNQNTVELELKGESGIYFIQLTNEKGERANLKVVKH